MRAEKLKSADSVLIEKCFVAKRFFSRFMGLMGRATLPEDEAILFPRCNSVHTFFMRFPIDVVFVAKDGLVVEVVEAMAPWRLCSPRWAAKHTLELSAGRAAALGIRPGSRLDCGGFAL